MFEANDPDDRVCASCSVLNISSALTLTALRLLKLRCPKKTVEDKIAITEIVASISIIVNPDLYVSCFDIYIL